MSESSHVGGGAFPNTRWSVILSLDDDEAAGDALGQLCQAYWFPLYAYVRRGGRTHHEAEDLTQAFFFRLLERDSFADARREKGRLRTFLLTLMKRFLINEWKKDHAEKRGGSKVILSIDEGWAEQRYQHEPADPVTPEDLFERQWALTLLEGVLSSLREEYAARDKIALYDTLKDSIAWNSSDIPYARLGEQLDMTEGAIRVALHRLRKRYRELLMREIERTVETPEEVDDELRHLFSILKS